MVIYIYLLDGFDQWIPGIMFGWLGHESNVGESMIMRGCSRQKQ